MNLRKRAENRRELLSGIGWCNPSDNDKKCLAQWYECLRMMYRCHQQKELAKLFGVSHGGNLVTIREAAKLRGCSYSKIYAEVRG